MATEEVVNKTITTFSQIYPRDGFVIFNSLCSCQFHGNLLLNYEGLRILQFKKTQLKQGDFIEQKFQQLCMKVYEVDPNIALENLFKELKSTYPNLLICVISGDVYKAVGELASFKKNQLSAYLY